MRLTIPIFLERMSGVNFQYFPNEICESKHISEISFLQNNKSINPDTLYITNQSFLTSSYIGEIPKKIACIHDTNDYLNRKRFQYSDLIFFENSLNTTELFVMLQDIFYYYTAVFNRLLEIIKENKGLQSLLEEIAAILGNPGSIVDRNLKVLAGIDYMPNTVNDSFYSEYVKNIQSNGYSIGGPKSEMEDYLSRLSCSTDKPVIFEACGECEYVSISYNIKLQNKNVGWLNVFEVEKPFSEATSDLIIFFSEILSLEMSKNVLYTLNELTKYEFLLTDLLDGKSLSDYEIEALLNFLQLQKSNYYTLVVISSSVFLDSMSKLNFFRAKILAFTRCSMCILYKQRIVVVFESSSNDPFTDLSLSKLEELLTDSNIFAGVSKSFTNIIDSKKGYIEAVKAIELGTKLKMSGSIFRYKDLQLFRLIDLCSKQENIMDFCVPSLNKLIENDPELSMTLYHYLRNGKSQTKTAKELHIQRNSLLYRLKKIEEILGLKLDDYNSVLHIQLSYEILNYLGLDNHQ